MPALTSLPAWNVIAMPRAEESALPHAPKADYSLRSE
jgi:hypothetical protein